MKKNIYTTAFLLWSLSQMYAQNPFPTGGFTLPAGKTIVITYDVTVNTNACTNNTIPIGNLANQSQVQGSNFATVNTDDPDVAGASDHTVTPFGAITIGNMVYNDLDRNGLFDGSDVGLNMVSVNLYVDDGDGVLDAGDGAPIANTLTSSGLYSFTVCPGTYIVEVASSNFTSGGALYNSGAPYISSPIGSAPDPDGNTTDSDDNGDPVSGFGVATAAFTVAYNPNPAQTSEYNHIDLGFKTPTTVTIGDVLLLHEGTGGGPTAFNFTVSRSNNSETFSLTVNTSAGTATSGSDFTAISSGTVSFMVGGGTDATVTVYVTHDNIVENNETFFVNLSGAPPGVFITDGTGDGVINNDDNATLTLSGGGSGNELNSGTSVKTFTATLSAPVQDGFSVAYTTGGGTATAGSDYADSDGSLTFVGTLNEPQSWTVGVNGDNTVELDETFNGTLGTISGTSTVQMNAISLNGSPQTWTIANDDAATVSIAADASQSEAYGLQIFNVTLSNRVDVAVAVNFNTGDNTATTGENDYTGIVNQVVSFPANNATAQTISVVITNDNKVEADETYTVGIGSLSAGGRNVSLGTASRTGTILNNDTATVTLSPVGGVSQNEGNSGAANFTFTATVDKAVQGGFTLNYSTMDGTATSPSDYTGVSGGSLTFLGNALEAQNISIGVNGDLNIEANETFTVQLGTVTALTTVQTNAISTSGSPKTGTITNDEKDWGDAPTAAQSGFAGTYPTLATDNGANHDLAPGGLRLGATVDGDLDGQPNANATGDGADEDGVTLPSAFAIGTTANITVNASGNGSLNAWVDWNRNGTWESPSEQVFTNQTLTAGNNALSIAVPGGASTGNTYARFRFSNDLGLPPTGPASDGEVEDYQVSVVANTYSISSPTVTEGSAPGTVTLMYTISRLDNTNAGSVNYSAPTGTATAGTDYITIPAGTINFTAGGDFSETVSVTINGDDIVEDNETVVITLSNPVNGGIGTGTGTGIITNDDVATLTLAGGTIQNEGNTGTTGFIFTATLNKAVQDGFKVAYTTTGVTATAGVDFSDNDGMLTFAGNIGEQQSWTVDVNGDNTVELGETFEGALGAVTMTSAVQAAAISVSGSPKTDVILNDDAAVVSIAANVSQAENLSPQQFSVTLSNPVDENVTVNFNTADNTATTGDNDYTGIVNQVVTFNAGTTTAQTVNVVVNNDNKVEANETYTVGIGTLSASGRNVSLGTSTRTGTITNNDAATVTLKPTGGVSQNEGNTGTTNFVFTVELDNPVQGGFTLAYATNDGTATTADNDYVDNDATLTFADNSTTPQNITVQVNGDNKVEANETFTVALGGISGTTLGGSITLVIVPRTGTIQNDEVDWGDAPDPTYPTLSANDGARHKTNFGVHLGAGIDGETDGQPNTNADGDDTDAEGDDDDGVTLPGALVINTTANITVNASIGGLLNAWVDFNQNGSWESPSEQIFTNTALVSGNNALSFAVPPGATLGASYARFRFGNGNLAPTGLDNTGEVEDYPIEIVNTLFSIDNPTVTEGNSPGTSNLTFRISRNVNANACSVQYGITGGTATSGTDYQAFAGGTANFTAGGDLFQDITVTVNGDNTVELNETVVMTLSNPVNASILDGTGTGQITNDDQGVITISNPTVTEGNAGTVDATFTITLSNPSDANVLLDYTAEDVTATLADNDFQYPLGITHTFTPGQTMKTVSVPVVGDCAIEPNEQFILRLIGLDNNGRNVILSGNNHTLLGIGTITNDDALPEITCPTDATYDTDPGECSALITLPLPTLGSICGSNTLEWRGRAVDGANQPLQPYSAYTPAANNTAAFNKGRFQIEWKVTDGSGTSTCSYFIEIEDNELPSITCPGPVTVTCSSQVPPVNLAAVTASDNCPGVVKSHVGDVTTNMTCANRKTITRTYRATDGSGNSTTCSQVITVFDNVKPVFTFVPANVTVQCNSIPAVGSPSASDGCGGAVTITYNGQSSTPGSCADRYTLTRQWTATDACGNTKTATQRINVIDSQQPNFTSTPANITVQCDAVPPVATPTATDNCDAMVAISYNGQTTTSGACPNAYTLTRRWTAADNCNNTRSISQRITVVDNGKPVFTSFPANTTIACNETPPAVGSPTASDGCGGATVTYLGQSTTSGNCPGNYQIRRTWRATDACGNSTVSTQTIQVSDGGLPVFTSVPGPLTIECGDPLPPLVNPTASDACGYAAVTFLGNVPSGSGCAADYTVTRTWRAEDLCGNSATTSQVITVLGNNYREEGAENRVAEPTRRTTGSRPTNHALQPNPTTDRFWLDLTDFAGEAVTVSVLSDLGQLVWERRIPVVEDLKLSVSLREAGAAAGIYTVSVRSASGVVATRVVLVE